MGAFWGAAPTPAQTPLLGGHLASQNRNAHGKEKAGGETEAVLAQSWCCPCFLKVLLSLQPGLAAARGHHPRAGGRVCLSLGMHPFVCDAWRAPGSWEAAAEDEEL